MLLRHYPDWFARNWFRVGIALDFLLPAVILTLLDIVERFEGLRIAIVLLPVTDLSQQIRLWYRHVKRFGFPSPSTVREMWGLDAMRAYQGDSHGGRVDDRPRGHLSAYVAVFLLIAGTNSLLWLITGFSTCMYFTVLFVVLAGKRIMRLARPPAVLVLATSSPEATALQMAVASRVWPLQVASCLRHPGAAGGLIYFNSYRTAQENEWKQMVEHLLHVVPMVLIDLRHPTERVEFEIRCALRVVPTHRLFFIGSGPTGLAIPPTRRFTPAEVLDRLPGESGINPGVGA